MSTPTTTHYDVLGVAPTATEEEIRVAFKKAARRAHPDLGGSAEQMGAVNLALEVLTDYLARHDYDALLRGEVPEPEGTVNEEPQPAGPTQPDAPPAAQPAPEATPAAPRPPTAAHGWLITFGLALHLPLLIGVLVTGMWVGLLFLPAAHIAPIIWRGIWHRWRWRGFVGFLVPLIVGFDVGGLADMVVSSNPYAGELTLLATLGAAVFYAALARRR